MIYLNNAATSYPKPERVIKAVKECIEHPMFHASRTGYENQKKDTVSLCRQALADLFNIRDSDRIVFTSCSTESLNLALNGLQMDGGHAVTTTIEHNSVLRPLKTMEREGRIRLSIVDCKGQGDVDVEEVAAQIGPDTRAVVVNHCSNVTGAVTDIKTLGNIVSEKRIPYVVDVSQSAGAMSVDVEECRIDLLAFTGHKSLYGMPGIGGLYIRENIDLRPLKIGGTGVRSDYLFQPESMPMYYEAGTPNMPGIISLLEGVSFVLETGVQRILEHKQRCVKKIIEAFEKNEKIEFYAAGNGNSSYPTLLSFNVKGMNPADVGYMLENSFEIAVRSGLHCAPLIHKAVGSFPDGSVRVSPSFFTTDQELEYFLESIETICEAGDAL